MCVLLSLYTHANLTHFLTKQTRHTFIHTHHTQTHTHTHTHVNVCACVTFGPPPPTKKSHHLLLPLGQQLLNFVNSPPTLPSPPPYTRFQQKVLQSANCVFILFTIKANTRTHTHTAFEVANFSFFLDMKNTISIIFHQVISCFFKKRKKPARAQAQVVSPGGEFKKEINVPNRCRLSMGRLRRRRKGRRRESLEFMRRLAIVWIMLQPFC